MYEFGPRTGSQHAEEIQRQIIRLEGLVPDLRSVMDGSLPTAASLIEAHPETPLLDEWRFSLRPAVCLEGFVTGHPKLPGIRRPIATSELWLMSEELGWARTYSRWYLLGRRHGRTSGEC